jgi:hypothetical protein
MLQRAATGVRRGPGGAAGNAPGACPPAAVPGKAGIGRNRFMMGGSR